MSWEIRRTKGKIEWTRRASQKELDDVDNCKLCEIMPELEKTCYATRYCHRQMRIEELMNKKEVTK